MALHEATRQRIVSLIPSKGVVLFMKGNRSQPQCGFSARVVQILDSVVDTYETVDVLADHEVREGIKEFSNWPTIPQVYIDGEFVGGCDIVTEMYGSGELHQMLGKPVPERKIPKLTVTPAAAKALQGHLDNNPGAVLFLGIDNNYEPTLGLRPRQGHEIAVESNGITVIMDAMTAERAEGVVIDMVEGLGGASFKVDNPNAPKPVRQLSPREVKQMIDAGAKFEFLDVRSPDERATASIPGTRLLDADVAHELEALPRDTTLVFHCHHGGRSQQAAEHFRRLGFKDVINVAGGIDAWSAEVDPSIPRY